VDDWRRRSRRRTMKTRHVQARQSQSRRRVHPVLRVD
jgi:hypothetical protein